MPQPRKTTEVQSWLATQPSLAELRERFPAEWAVVERDLREVTESGDQGALTAYVKGLATPKPVGPGAKPSRSGLDARTAAAVRQQMAAAAIRSLSVRLASGVTTGRVRFGRFNGSVIQRLLFKGSGLERKPVSLRWFRLWWPRLKERQRLMPLVQPQGIYCFYSGAFVAELAKLIDDRSALEIAAGDGTLTRFLLERGTEITATDDHSWTDVQFPAGVERLDAKAALKAHTPTVVVCSWPPAGNDFEAAVFATAGVELYVVVGSRHTAGWGNQAAYAAAEPDFELTVDPRLSAMILPPELDPAVYVFRRRA